MDVKAFLIEVSKNSIPGHSLLHKFGRNNAVPDGTWELVSLLSSGTSLRTSPSTVRIKAGGHAADTFNGLGAREITVMGINGSLAEASETIVTSGASASSPTTNSFWRIYRAYVSAVGYYGATNAGAITIEDSGGVEDMNVIGNGNGQTQHAAYTIPAGKTGHLLSVYLTVNSTAVADFRLFTKENLDDVSAPMPPKRLRLFWDGISLPTLYKPQSPEFSLEAGTDIWIEAKGNGATAKVVANFEILLVDNPVADVMTM